jgi:N-acetylglucosamine kinase-like BadF-type ATPase
MRRALTQATEAALASAGLDRSVIAGAGFGIAGFDWETERATMLETIGVLRLTAPVGIVNDAVLGVIAGAAGRSRYGTREGMVTGAGQMMGEAAGASELVRWAVAAVSQAWTRRGPATRLADALVEYAGARDVEDLLEGIINARYQVKAAAAPLVFDCAGQGDAVAQALVERAGCELGELAKAVIRQLEFENESFDVVLIGGMFNAGEVLVRPLRETVLPLAPGARFVRLGSPPVVGAVLLGMEQVGRAQEEEVCARLNETIQPLRVV